MISHVDPEVHKPVRWKPGTTLTYVVQKSTFTDVQYKDIIASIEVAAGDWHAVTGIDLRRIPEGEAGPASSPVTFTVHAGSPSEVNLATSFFPNDAPCKRHIVIGPRLFRTNNSHVGVLRHELGHVMGFNHANDSPVAPTNCSKDSELSAPITGYDPHSVMLMVCDLTARPNIELSDGDRAGARRVYGLPSGDIVDKSADDVCNE